MQLKDVTPIIKAILDERNKIPLIINTERYIPNWQPNQHGNAMRGGIRKALRAIEQAPVVDAVPVVHGRWIKDKGGNTYCSRCDAYIPAVECVHRYPGEDDEYYWDQEINETDYCPNCGAKMDGGSE